MRVFAFQNISLFRSALHHHQKVAPLDVGPEKACHSFRSGGVAGHFRQFEKISEKQNHPLLRGLRHHLSATLLPVSEGVGPHHESRPCGLPELRIPQLMIPSILDQLVAKRRLSDPGRTYQEDAAAMISH